MIGETLAHYEVSELLGEGGMGRVFRARDTRLDRDVAIKLLPQEVAADPERIARFEREARTLAQLQHPHIASVYGFEEVGEHRLLVMELAEGHDLAARLADGPLPAAEALEIARQVALGLEEAHEKGIVHRDLKPANVMLTADGRVKILDFGLARAFEEPTSVAQLEHSPTITAAMTRVGVILGTAAYMSPEQARGRPVDPRTDVWAFGAMLFEMLSGRQPFEGEVVSDIVARILEREPAWEELPEELHPAVDRLLRRCLTKDPRDRLHSIADARFDLEEALRDPTGGAIVGDLDTPPAPPGRRALPWVVAAVLGAVALALALRPAPEAPTRPRLEFQIPNPPGQHIAEFALAPGASAVVFAAVDPEGSRSLWLRRLDAVGSERLEGTEGAMFPFWAPDDRSIAFFARGKLRRLDLSSGTVQTVADAPNGRGGAWNEDGTILFTPQGEDILYSVPATGGEPRAVTELLDDQVTHRFPHFLPDGRRFTFAAQNRSLLLNVRFLASLDSDETLPLPDGASEVYAPPGHLLFVRERTLLAQAFDASSGRLVGSPSPLVGDIETSFPRVSRSSYSVSDTGVLAVLRIAEAESRFGRFDRDGRSSEILGPPGVYVSPVLSPDGRRIAFGQDRWTSVWVLDLERGSSTRILQDVEGLDTSAGWSPDGSALLLGRRGDILLQPLDGSPPDRLWPREDQDPGEELSAIKDIQMAVDESFVVFVAWDPVTDYDLWRFELDGSSVPERLARASRVQERLALSPDGRWLAYQSDESGRYEVYVRSADSGETRWLLSTDGGHAPSWNADGSELTFLSPTGDLTAVSFRDEGSRTPTIGLPEPLFRPPVSPSRDILDRYPRPLLAGRLEDDFLFQVPAGEPPRHAISVVVGWESLLGG